MTVTGAELHVHGADLHAYGAHLHVNGARTLHVHNVVLNVVGKATMTRSAKVRMAKENTYIRRDFVAGLRNLSRFPLSPFLLAPDATRMHAHAASGGRDPGKVV